MTALEKHSLNYGHNFYFNNVKVLYNNNKYKRRVFLEVIYIKNDGNVVILDLISGFLDIRDLSCIYNNIFQQYN